jgi:hypothetical protein
VTQLLVLVGITLAVVVLAVVLAKSKRRPTGRRR